MSQRPEYPREPFARDRKARVSHQIESALAPARAATGAPLMAEEIDKYEEDVDRIIDTGKEKGYLTYGEVNDLLPGDITTPDDLDDLLTTINTQGIDVLNGESKFG